ncbi:MAG: dicarboxylate/amino acid:cation symporter [Gammaproteobacteria bacterium TMED78]|nr:MAG: dicarboxylate/amino acid:cation symporter [Gammaproteobacteria bacterium TMED78]|tara:strand:+ start:25740 stop:26957 length:1218 start_codon:yes stop_codon:yes gene_type:complete
MNFTQRIIISMVLGVLFGIILNISSSILDFNINFLVEGILYPVGTIFISLLKLMVIPLVFVSIICGVSSLGNLNALRRISIKTVLLYMLTTSLAIIIALLVAYIISPGAGVNISAVAEYSFQSQSPPQFRDVIVNLFPDNPIRAMADGEILQVIIFSLLFGFALVLLGEKGSKISSFFIDLNEVIIRMVFLVISIAPIGVFALIARTFAIQGADVFLPLLSYSIAVMVGLLLQLSLVYSSLLFFSNRDFFKFLNSMRTPVSFAFSTASSSATIPITLDAVEKNLHVKKSISSFTVPLGATINMDGTAIMQGVATVFIANVYAIDLVFSDYLMVIITATLASIGTAAVPSAGMIMLAMVLEQVGLPVEGIALVLGIDRLLDMFRTSINILGDAAITCFIDKTEDKY